MWFFNKKKSEVQSLIDEIKNENFDMQSLFSNISNRTNCEALYKHLAKQIHPDKFERRAEKQQKAHNLFSKLQAHRNEYSYMQKLEEEINQFIKD